MFFINSKFLLWAFAKRISEGVSTRATVCVCLSLDHHLTFFFCYKNAFVHSYVVITFIMFYLHPYFIAFNFKLIVINLIS